MSLPPIGFVPNQQRGLLRQNNQIKNASNVLSAQPSDIFSLRFGANNNPKTTNKQLVQDYLKALKQSIEVTQEGKSKVDELIQSIRTASTAQSAKTAGWGHLPNIREKLENLAVQQGVDFALIQDDYDIGPRQSWVRENPNANKP